MDKTFTFEYTTRCVVRADNITEAMRKFRQNECESITSETDPEMLRSVLCTDKDGTWPMAVTRSKVTGQAIWYEPGCPDGNTDCIFDPMEEIAAACAQQEDLVPGKQTMCDSFDAEEDSGRGCSQYDDECK